mgnify:CR=1 FL=1
MDANKVMSDQNRRAAHGTDVFDVTIIGGGPAGLYSAFYSGLREMKTKIIEVQPHLGGKLHFYPEKVIWDVGGLPPTTGEQLIGQLVRQATMFEPEIVLNEKVAAISKNENGIFVLHTESGALHYSRTVILAVGGGIVKPVKLQLEGAEQYEQSNLHYSVKSIARFRDKVVLVSGGGNSAIDWANELSLVARKVYLTYRKDALKGYEASVAQLEQGGVRCLLNTEIVSLVPAVSAVSAGDPARIGKAALKHLETGATAELEVDEVVVCHGYERNQELLQNSAIRIEMANEYCVKATPTGETNVPGLFAAGDIAAYEGKVYLIAGCFHDAANAVNMAKRHIAPEAEAYAMVSSHNELFKERNREWKKQYLRN